MDGFDLVEVWNGLWQSDRAWNADNEEALARWADSLTADVRHGRWRPAIGNSDTHLSGQIGTPHTVVMAGDRTTQAILAGLRAGRSWIAESADVDLTFVGVAGGRSAGIGDRLHCGGEAVDLHIAVRGVPSGRVGVRTDHGQVQGIALTSDGTMEWRTTVQDAAFVRREVRRAGGQMAALTNPIVLD